MKIELKLGLLRSSNCKMASIPRIITAAEILEDRRALFENGGSSYWPHDYEAPCDCPKCRDYYDPTGEESAKYLNMDPSSFFTMQSDIPSFSLIKIAKESFWAAAGPGFYFDNGSIYGVRDMESFITQLTPPLAIYPTHILHIGQQRAVDRFFLSDDKKSWTRRTWKDGRGVFYHDGKNPPIPADTSNAALRQRLTEIFSV